MAPTRVEALEEAAASAADRARFRTLNDLVWPPQAPPARDPRASAPPPPRDWPPGRRARVFVVRDAEGAVVAKAHARPRAVTVGGTALDVLALAGVLAHPEHRGRGYGVAIVRAALEWVDDGAFPVALFQTGIPAFYAKLGARAVTNRRINSRGVRPGVDPFWDPYVMVYPAGARWPAGVLDTWGPAW